MENMKSINLEDINNLNDQVTNYNLENSFIRILNSLECSKLEKDINGTELDLEQSSIHINSNNYYLQLKQITVQLNQINKEIKLIKYDIQNSEDNNNNNGINKDLNINKLKNQERILTENRQKIQKIIDEKQKEYITIKDKIKIIREGLKEDKLKVNIELKEIIFTESSRMFTLELELSHLERENNNYFKKIEEVQRKIKLTYNNRDRLYNETLKLKEKLHTFQEKLIDKENALKKYQLARVNLENIINDFNK